MLELNQEIAAAFDFRFKDDTKDFGHYENALIDHLRELVATDDESFLIIFILLYHIITNVNISSTLIFRRFYDCYLLSLGHLKCNRKLIETLKTHEPLELELENKEKKLLWIPQEIESDSSSSPEFASAVSYITSSDSTGNLDSPSALCRDSSSDSSLSDVSSWETSEENSGAIYDPALDSMFGETPKKLASTIYIQLMYLESLVKTNNSSDNFEIMEKIANLIKLILNDKIKCIEYRDQWHYLKLQHFLKSFFRFSLAFFFSQHSLVYLTSEMPSVFV